MKVLGFTLLTLVATVSTAPTVPKPGEPDACIKECINGVLQYGEELSILKNPNLSKYFNKLDEVCEVITTARNCVQKCGAEKNPFALESLNIVCQPDTAEQIAIIKQCLRYIGNNIDEACNKECSSDRIIDETDVATPKMNPLMQKANIDCSTFKCMARCNVAIASNQCGKDLGNEFQGLLQHVLDIQRRDLENLNLIEAMSTSTPPQCNYLYEPNVLFGNTKKEDPAPASPNPSEDAKSLYAQAQLQLLLKQIELTEKQDQLIDRENAKLDMEMAYMHHKAQLRDERFHAQHAVPMFVPDKDSMPHIGSMHAAPMTEEPSHPEQHEPEHEQAQPEQSHEPENHPSETMQNQPEPSEPEHEQSQPMESHEPPPVVPAPAEAPEEPHHSMPEQPHFSMPMEPPHPTHEEPHPPMPMEGIPIEMIMAQQQLHHEKPPKGPLPIFSMPPEGAPMEPVPMEFVPVAMSMPMEAMPRFL